MKLRQLMLVAGETSGDMLAAELVNALRRELGARPLHAVPDYQPLDTTLSPRFFGAGGQAMAAAGVDLEIDLTQHAVIGLSDVIKHLFKFRRLLNELAELAAQRQPGGVVLVDFSGFNVRLAHAIRRRVARQDWFHDWTPKLVQFVSPQVWASRPGRAKAMARTYDLLLSIFPFEKDWYARRVPRLPVEFVGHPMVDRYEHFNQNAAAARMPDASGPSILFLPGSRSSELRRHLPVLIDALEIVRKQRTNLLATLVLPNDQLAAQAKEFRLPADLKIQIGSLPQALMQADLAIASTGTVTLECAYFGVPTVALYKTSWTTYHIAKRIITVKHLAMPNLLAHEELFPELIQDAATAQSIAKTALDLLNNQTRREQIKAGLAKVREALGPPGAARRAAQAIIRLLDW